MNGQRRASQRQKRRYPVAILGAFGIDNFGNDATLDAVMHSLTSIEPGDVLCVCSEVEYVRSRFDLDGDYLHGPPNPHPWPSQFPSVALATFVTRPKPIAVVWLKYVWYMTTLVTSGAFWSMTA